MKLKTWFVKKLNVYDWTCDLLLFYIQIQQFRIHDFYSYCINNCIIFIKNCDKKASR